MIDEYTKETWNNTYPNLIMIGLLFVALLIFKPPTWGTILFLIIAITVKGIILKDLKFKQWLRSVLITSLFIYTISFLYAATGVFGAATAFIIMSFLLATYILWVKRKEYFNAIRHVETQLFGKSLDKENWQRGEKPRWKYKQKSEKDTQTSSAKSAEKESQKKLLN